MAMMTMRTTRSDADGEDGEEGDPRRGTLELRSRTKERINWEQGVREAAGRARSERAGEGQSVACSLRRSAIA